MFVVGVWCRRAVSHSHPILSSAEKTSLRYGTGVIIIFFVDFYEYIMSERKAWVTGEDLSIYTKILDGDFYLSPFGKLGD